MIKYSAVFLCFLMISCKSSERIDNKLNEIQYWKLKHRMLLSKIAEDYDMGLMQFDSLLNSNYNVEPKYLGVGMEMLKKTHQEQKLAAVFNKLDEEARVYICNKGLFDDLATENKINKCADIKEETITHPELQKELVILYYNDQKARGGDMSELARQFNLNEDSITYGGDGMTDVDAITRQKLKSIIAEHGFPSKAMVGDVGMRGTFLVIQHADNDVAFQKSQFQNIENAVKRGDLEGQHYALLYDRIKVNSGELQLYGTQFARVEAENFKAELAPVEDMENLEKRRMELDLMPLEVYKELMFLNVKRTLKK